MRLLVSMAAVTALTTSTAFAAGLAEPLVEPEVLMSPEVVAEETVSSGNYLVPLLMLAAIVALASASGGGGGSGPAAAAPLKPVK
ncbi:hypothetical protein N9C96_02400 [bacterium]|nr:hypothetical protein [bacterium]